MQANYDAILLVSFGGPEKMEDVFPFLAKVTAGRNIPEQRIRIVARHYELFGGVSPINSYCRTLISSLRAELLAAGFDIPIYWGNRNWHPLLPSAVQQMADHGVKRALAFITAAYDSYSSFDQYIENIESARMEVQAGARAPEIDVIAPYYNHPLFIDANAEHLLAALGEVADGRCGTRVLFTAHSIPAAMARECPYESQLRQACRLVANKAAVEDWELVFQSRSGNPAEPWLEPDINEYINRLNVAEATGTPVVEAGMHAAGTAVRATEAGMQAAGAETRNLVVMPIGFICDHMEVVYSLDVEAAQIARARGLNFVRAATAGNNRKFVRMVRDLILERINGTAGGAEDGGAAVDAGSGATKRSAEAGVTAEAGATAVDAADATKQAAGTTAVVTS